MDFKDLVKERYSVRSYDSKPVEKEKLDLVLEAARVAPSAVNKQPTKIYVLESDEALKTRNELTQFQFGAPITLLVGWDKSRSVKGDGIGNPDYDMGHEDASIAATSMLLQAADLGLGTVWIGGFNHEALKKAFGLPADFEPLCFIDLGYPSDNAAPAKLHEINRPMEEIVTVL